MRRMAAAVMLHEARGAYVAGVISVDELEEKVERALLLDERRPRPHDCARDGHVIPDPIDITALGDPVPRVIYDPACRVCGEEP